MTCSVGTDCDISAGYLDGLCLAHWERAHTAEVPALLAEAVESMTLWRARPYFSFATQGPGLGSDDPSAGFAQSGGSDALSSGNVPCAGPLELMDVREAAASRQYVPERPPEYIPDMAFRPLRPPKPDPPPPPQPRRRQPGIFARLAATWRYHRRLAAPWMRSWWVSEPRWLRWAPLWAWTTGAGGVVMLGIELAPWARLA